MAYEQFSHIFFPKAFGELAKWVVGKFWRIVSGNQKEKSARTHGETEFRHEIERLAKPIALEPLARELEELLFAKFRGALMDGWSDGHAQGLAFDHGVVTSRSLLEWALVGLGPIRPTPQPHGFILRLGVCNAARENPFRGISKFNRSCHSCRLPLHFQQNLSEAPTLSLVTFLLLNAFSLEVHVVDQRINTLGTAGYRIEIVFQFRPFGRSRRGVGLHFWQGALKAMDDEVGLNVDRLFEKSPELIHLSAVFGGMKFIVAVPGTILGGRDPRWHRDVLLFHEGHQFWPALIKRPGSLGGVPDEVPNSQAREIFVLVPTG